MSSASSPNEGSCKNASAGNGNDNDSNDGVMANNKEASSDNSGNVSDGSNRINGSIVGGDNQKLLVQDFMSYLAKEGNIASMTVETSDGRRISAKFEGEIAVPTPNTADLSVKAPKAPNNAGSSKQTTAATKATDTDNTGENNIRSDKVVKGAEIIDSTPTSSSLPILGLEAFTSRDWSINYQDKHVEVSGLEDPKNCATDNKSLPSPLLTSSTSNDSKTSLRPKKRSATKTEGGSPETEPGKPKWNAMSALADAATVAQRQREQNAGIASADGITAEKITTGGAPTAARAISTSSDIQVSKKKATKRKPRKIIPDVKEYVEFTETDVLFGRGGRSNHHPGNKAYRDIVTRQQDHYRSCDKNEKTKVAQGIVDHVHNEINGRFLELDKDCQRWFLVPHVVARRKVGQALRENNTEEARAAKRAKYQGKLNSLKKNSEVAKSGRDMNSIAPIADIDISTVKNVIPIVTADSNNNVIPIDVTESTNRVEV